MKRIPAVPDHPFGLGRDLESVLEHAADDLAGLDGTRVLVTGGTGFVGRWLLELATWAAERLAISPHIVVTSRDPAQFCRQFPHLGTHRTVSMMQGDVRHDLVAPAGPVDFAVAGAAASLSAGDAHSEHDVHDTMVKCATFAHDVSAEHGCRVLLLSSGAAARSGPDAYGRAKQESEHIVRQGGGAERAVIARLYTFVGPYLPLDLNFAVGNFLADALAGRAIRVKGDGTATRSYLYAGDLAWWLWALLIKRGEAGRTYDVGSPDPVTISELAATVAGLAEPPVLVAIGGQPVTSSAGEVYVPNTGPARACGLYPTWSLEAALKRTYDWHRAHGTVSSYGAPPCPVPDRAPGIDRR